MPGPIEVAAILVMSTIAAISGFRWGKHATLTMCRHDEEGTGQ